PNYAAGHLVDATNNVASVQFEYDRDGHVTVRREHFRSDGSACETTRRFGNDGRVLDVAVNADQTPSPVVYGLWYDSAGRPIMVKTAKHVLWQAKPTGEEGAYDSFGRFTRFTEADGHIQGRIAYSPFTAMPTSQVVRVGSRMVYGLAQL